MTLVGVLAAPGVDLEVHAPEPLAGVLRAVFTDLLVPRRRAAHTMRITSHRGGLHDIWRDRDLVGWDLDAAHVVARCLELLNDAVAGSQAATRTVLHSAVVERGGAAVAFVGHSGAGKSTLCAAAVRAGRGFVADELGLVDDAHVVHGYHRPLGLRPRGVQAAGLTPVDDAWFGLVRPVAASSIGRLVAQAPVALVVLVDRTPAERCAAVDVAPAEALVELLNNTVGTEAVERHTFRRLDALVRAVPVVRITRDEPDEMLAVVDGRLATLGVAAPR